MTGLLVVTVVLLVAGVPLVAGAAVTASTDPTDTSGSRVDVVVVFDSSESTNDDRYHIAKEIDALADRFESDGIDARYGLVTYSETARVALPLTSDFASFDRAMHFPEAGNVEHTSDAIVLATTMDFREDAERFIVVVTDEDDDSTNASREEALTALPGFHFVAVSPSAPAESSCAVHSPPCDDRADNELRTMAGLVGGDWIDQGEDAATIVSGIADILAPRADTESAGSSSSRPDRHHSTSRPTYVTTNHSATPTTAEIGDLVTFTKTVENVGSADGTYRAYLSHDGVILAEQTISIPEGESRTIEFVHRFETPGAYEVLISHEVIATVNVTEPANVSINTTVPTNGTGVQATIEDAWTNATVTIPLTDASLAPRDVAVFNAVVVSVGDVNVTPDHDVAFTFDILTNETPTNGTAPLPEHISGVRYLTVNDSIGADLVGVQFEYSASADGTTLYRYDDANATWVPLDGTPVNGSDTQWRTDRSEGSRYAVGVREPEVSVTQIVVADESIILGDSTTVDVTLQNAGAAGTFNATVRLNGSVLGAVAVGVPADGVRTVSFTVSPDRPGLYTLDVPEGPSATLEVTAAPTTTVTQLTTESPIQEQTQLTTESPIQDQTSSSLPGFGLVVALVAVGLTALLASRRD